jgi:hypothetical protein
VLDTFVPRILQMQPGDCDSVAIANLLWAYTKLGGAVPRALLSVLFGPGRRARPAAGPPPPGAAGRHAPVRGGERRLGLCARPAAAVAPTTAAGGNNVRDLDLMEALAKVALQPGVLTALNKTERAVLSWSLRAVGLLSATCRRLLDRLQ